MKPIQLHLCSLLLVCLFSCNSDQSKNPELFGKWYYGDAPLSYTEITEDIWTDYLGEMGLVIKHKIYWKEGSIKELEIMEINRPISIMQVGYKTKMEIQEVRSDLLQYNFVSPNGRTMCVYLLKEPQSDAKPSVKC